MSNRNPFALTLLGNNASENLKFINSDLQITARLQGNMANTKKYDFYVYDEQLMQMGYLLYERDAARISLKNQKLKANMYCPLVWTPGKYFLLMVCRQDDHYFLSWRADFELDDHLQFRFTGARPCDGMDLDATLINFFGTDKKPTWHRLANLPGVRQMKLRVLERMQQEWVNGMRKEAHQEELWLNNHYLVTVPSWSFVSQAMTLFRALAVRGFEYETVDCSELYDPLLPNNPYEKLQQLFPDNDSTNLFEAIHNANKKKFYCMKNLSVLNTAGGKPILRKFEASILSNSPSSGIVLVGTPQEINALFEQHPTFRDYFPEENKITFEPFTLSETIRCFFERARVQGMAFGREMTNYMGCLLSKAYEQGAIRHWRQKEIDRYLYDCVRPRMMRRMTDILSNDIERWKHETTLVQRGDIDEAPLLRQQSNYQDTLRELNQMVGLADVKKSIATLSNRMRFFIERRQLGLNTSGDLACHAIFTGNPGTGKTTVARLLGKIYHSLGLLSRGDVITVDRSRIIGRFIGDTEENMRQILQEAQGNVLFIDEAYTLYSNESCNDFGKRAIEVLLPVLTQPEPDMLVILAGYENEMDKLMSMNPGLVGRFPYKFKFKDYHADELMQIAENTLEKEDYLLTDGARHELRRTIEETIAHPTAHFGNARWIEQYVRNGIISALADRIVAAGMPASRADYQRIETADVVTAFEKFNTKTIELKPHRAVGFSA